MRYLFILFLLIQCSEKEIPCNEVSAIQKPYPYESLVPFQIVYGPEPVLYIKYLYCDRSDSGATQNLAITLLYQRESGDDCWDDPEIMVNKFGFTPCGQIDL